MATYITVDYDGQAGGEFVVEGANVTWTGGGVGFVVSDLVDGTAGTLKMALVAGPTPSDNDVLTQGGVTANANGAVGFKIDTMLYPAYFREDVQVAASGAITWTGPALGATHSFFFDAQTANVVAGEILTFSGGQTCEVITVEADAGATGELSVRFISEIDQGLPVDNDTFTGDIAGDGTLNGVIHPRSYTPLEIHRLLSDLNDDSTVAGNDDLSIVDPTASDRSTDQIVTLLGTVAINDTVSQHMYGGSISQSSGATLYSGMAVQVTTANTATQPVLVQFDPATGVEAIITDYWKNAYNPDSISGKVRILRKTRDNGADIDGRRVKGKLLEFGDSYFEGSTTLGTAETSLALFSANDGNNNTAVGTVAGAPYNTVVFTEGYQTLDFNEGSGLTPFHVSVEFGTANSLQAYERTKYIQRRGTAETAHGRNGQLLTGVNRNFAYDTEAGGNFLEDATIAWGTRINYDTEAGGPFTVGEVVTFGTSLAVGRVLFLDDDGTTGVLVIDLQSGTPADANTITGATSGATAVVSTSGVTLSTRSGTGLLMALDDQGTTGNMYYQKMYGVDPANNDPIYSLNAAVLVSAAVNGAVSTRTINNQFVGVYTGVNYQTNFGIAIDTTDAIAGDIFPNLLGNNIAPPDNRSGTVSNLIAGDYVTVFPWDGAAADINGDAEPDFNEMTLATALIAATSTTVEVGASNIPANTPAAGYLRIERDSDGNLDLLEYSSFVAATGIFTLVGTAPSAAAIANTVMRAFVDKVAVSASESYSATYSGGGQDVAVTVRRGGTSAPIKTFKTTANFGAFNISTIRTPDA